MIASCHIPMRHVTYQCVMQHDCSPHVNASRNESSDVWVDYMLPSVCMTHVWISHIWMRCRLLFLQRRRDSQSRDASHVTHTWMSHVTHMSESRHTHEWVYSHIWMSHVIRMNESCHTYKWVMSYTWMNRVTRVNESCHTNEWVMPPPPPPPPTPAQQLEHGKRPPPWGLLE